MGISIPPLSGLGAAAYSRSRKLGTNIAISGADATGTVSANTVLSTVDTGADDIVLGPGLFRVGSNITLSSRVVYAGGAFTIDAGKTLTLAQWPTAPDDAPIFQGAGAVVIARTGDVPIGWFDPAADGATADDAPFNRCNACVGAAIGSRMKLGPYVYALGTDKNLTAMPIGAGRTRSRLKFTASASNRPLRLYGWTDGVDFGARPQQYSASDAIASRRDLLNDQGPGLTAVTLSTSTDAANYAPGDLVMIMAGRDPLDADDDLWIVQEVHRVVSVNATTGVVRLERPIERPLQSWGFEPGGDFYDPSAWADATGYSEGNFVKDASRQIWEAMSAGTSSGTGPEDDTGVSWRQITRDTGAGNFGTPAMDHRPMIAKAATLTLGDLVGGGFTVENAKGSGMIMALEVKSVYGSDFEDIDCVGGFDMPFHPAEGTNFCNFRRFRISDEVGGQAGGTPARSFKAYAARNIVIDDCAGYGDYAEHAYFEAFSTVRLRNMQFASPTEEASEDAIELAVGCEAVLDGVTILGYGAPVAMRGQELYLDTHWCHQGRLRSAANSRLGLSSKRGVGLLANGLGLSSAGALLGNDLLVFDGVSPHPDYVPFRADSLITFELQWAVSAGATAARVTWDGLSQPDAPFPDRLRALICHAELLLTGVPAAGEVDGRIRVYDGAAYRNVFGLSATDNRILQTGSDPYGFLAASTSNASRLLMGALGETLVGEFYSNASATAGTARLRVTALVERAPHIDANLIA